MKFVGIDRIGKEANEGRGLRCGRARSVEASSPGPSAFVGRALTVEFA